MELPFYKETLEPLVPQGSPVTSPHVDAIGKSLSQLEKMNRLLWNRLQRNTPVSYRAVASGQAVTGTPLVMNLGSPDSGTFWEIQNFAVGGLDINVTAAGSFGLYVSGYVGNVSPGLGALVDGANSSAGGTAAMPFTQTYGSRQILVNDSESVFVVIFNGTNAQTYVSTIFATVWNVAAGSGVDINVV
jgi:hypothetical protein